MKPTKTFKLRKSIKRMISLMSNSVNSRSQFKRMMIQAQLASEFVFKREKRRF